MGKLKLPRLLSDGMVLQQKKNVRIWGEDEPGRTVTVSFLGREYNGEVNAAGEWEIHIQPADACAACQMLIRDDAGGSAKDCRYCGGRCLYLRRAVKYGTSHQPGDGPVS